LIDNVRFHHDTVRRLWTFVEVEAIDFTGRFLIGELKEQFDRYIEFFWVKIKDLIGKSYSDMLTLKGAKE